MSAGPHLFDDVGVGLGDLSLHTQRVGEVQLLQVGALQEVLSQRRSVAQTLWTEEEETGGVRTDKRSIHGHEGAKTL